ncbi:MAG TPA: hypothetical protein VN426_07810 [Syntrophomonadaceae bacterium]|nr:hypothetical protein [Syntrophomonadaceae bacterium]
MLKRYRMWVISLLVLAILGGFGYRTIQQNGKLEQMRIRLLEDALAPTTAEGAAYSWAEAVKERNGAWQYAVMDDRLRLQHRKEFESSNWVTGFSSPWVENYQVIRQTQDDEGNISFKVVFDWYTSSGFAYSNSGTLVVSAFDKGTPNERWLLTSLEYSYEPEQ